MKISLQGKKALVCGSTQGIGKAIALEMAAAGAQVILVARNTDKLTEVLKELDVTHGQKHQFIAADFSKPEELKKALSLSLPSDAGVEILVNNTGGPAPGPILDAQEDAFLLAYNNHLICNHILVQHLSPMMKEKKYGRIINIISTSVKEPIPGLGVSNTTRAAVAGWSKTLSLELAPFGITVNNILPGYTKTSRLEGLIQKKVSDTGKSREDVEKEMLSGIPAGRFANPEELAALTVFLASPLAGYINGANIPVDGGKIKCF